MTAAQDDAAPVAVLLGRDAILAAEDLPHVDVAVPEWGGTVRVRAMTGAERDAFSEQLRDAEGKQYPIRLVAACAVDEAGKKIFWPQDVAELERKSAVALDRVATAAQRLNGVGQAAVEAAEKN